ncbi:hypothetical protein JG687_00017251 [Phytophthora cactorum]|uniref:BZIP domain-containing protein n=1 Tax=Phytophthora cactorum TaxID=29920 RepID=A0A329RX94_9STRA|nr:hypothetical protein Pcac1_g15675 [Phytophthora cactorum]KAG2813441.1 hypothetical protein PC111_g14386 [Phytophthora cactorum]KAG2818884.1 hypothetical protein PC112_g12417 [Phytophthora cactorum]KAG2851872.1 hypothetical protein PC113_g15521 [Phytophthora cactorum]KAG2904077.1 hypothetical protein PC115_g15102 [Phytophthora cactorum]
MNSCIHRRPTNRFLRDDVAGGSMHRNESFASPPQRPAPTYSIVSSRRRCETPDNIVAVVDGQFSPTDRKKNRQDSNDSPTSKLMLLAVPSSARAQFAKPEPRFKRGEDQKARMMQWIELDKKRQREIRRLKQIRYRKKKEDYTFQLERETQQLRQEIEKLEQRRRPVLTAVPPNKYLWSVVVEYFQLFHFGIRGETDKRAQLNFLQKAMATDVMFNAGRGIESIMRNWKYFTLWFQDVEVELHGLKRRGRNSIITSMTTSFTITESTLTTVFPHLCGREGGNARSPLADKLLGQRIVARGSTRFDWGTGDDRVTSIISESDMLTPMLLILGNLEDVSKVFEKSLIS